MNNLSMRFFKDGRFTEAEALLSEVLPIAKKRLGAKSHTVGVVLINLSGALCAQGRDGDETDRLRAEALTILRSPFDPLPELGITGLVEQAVSEYRRARFSDAELHLREALEAARQILPLKPSVQAAIHRELAGILIAIGNIKEATLRLQECVELNLKSGPNDSVEVASFMSLLALARNGQGHAAGHGELLADMMARFSSSEDPIRLNQLTWAVVRFRESPLNAEQLEKLGRRLLALKPESDANKITGAVALLRAGLVEEAVRLLQELRGARKGDFVYADVYLALAYRKLGRLVDAEEARTRAINWINRPEKFTRNWDLMLELKLLRRELDESFRDFNADLPINVFAP